MSEEQNNKDQKQEFGTKDSRNSMRLYGVYSAVVTQMLATMGLAFWGGKKLNDYWEIKSNVLTIVIGLTGMGLAFYNLLRQLKNIQDREDSKTK